MLKNWIILCKSTVRLQKKIKVFINRGRKERQGPTLGVRFTEVSVKRESTVHVFSWMRNILFCSKFSPQNTGNQIFRLWNSKSFFSFFYFAKKTNKQTNRKNIGRLGTLQQLWPITVGPDTNNNNNNNNNNTLFHPIIYKK